MLMGSSGKSGARAPVARPTDPSTSPDAGLMAGASGGRLRKMGQRRWPLEHTAPRTHTPATQATTLSSNDHSCPLAVKHWVFSLL